MMLINGPISDHQAQKSVVYLVIFYALSFPKFSSDLLSTKVGFCVFLWEVCWDRAV